MEAEVKFEKSAVFYQSARSHILSAGKF